MVLRTVQTNWILVSQKASETLLYAFSSINVDNIYVKRIRRRYFSFSQLVKHVRLPVSIVTITGSYQLIVAQKSMITWFEKVWRDDLFQPPIEEEAFVQYTDIYKLLQLNLNQSTTIVSSTFYVDFFSTEVFEFSKHVFYTFVNGIILFRGS